MTTTRVLLSAITAACLPLTGCGPHAISASKLQTTHEAEVRRHYVSFTGPASGESGWRAGSWGSTKAYAAALRAELVRRHGTLVAEHRDIILAGDLATGMSTFEAWLSWGEPNDRERSSSPYGRVDYWTYGNPGYSATYLTFHDDRLVWWRQEHR